MGPDPDAALMLAFQQGDEGAFRTLFERHARAMFGFCHHFVRDAARAEELAQDVFVNLYRARDRYRPSARFKTFLYRVASNAIVDQVRRFVRGGELRATGAFYVVGSCQAPSSPIGEVLVWGQAAWP